MGRRLKIFYANVADSDKQQDKQIIANIEQTLYAADAKEIEFTKIANQLIAIADSYAPDAVKYDDIDRLIEQIADDYLALHRHRGDKSVGYVLGGQPGAGKSILIKRLVNKHANQLVVVNGDYFRKFHPNYDALVNQYGKDSVEHTAEFAGTLVEKVINKAIADQQNIVIEGTFRTALTPIKTLTELKSNGYRTEVWIVSTNPQTSFQSTLERYQIAVKLADKSARATPKNHHDLVVSTLAENIEKVYASGAADKLVLCTRQTIVFDSENNHSGLTINSALTQIMQTA